VLAQSDVPVPPGGDDVPAGLKDDQPPHNTINNDEDGSSRARILFFADGPKSDSDASIEGDPRGSAPEEESPLIGEPMVVAVPVTSPRKREREVGQDSGGGTATVVDSIVISSSGGGGGGIGGGGGGSGEEDEGTKKLERKGSLSRMRHMVEKMVLKRKESREGERRATHDGSSTSAPPSPAPAPLVPTFVMTQRSQLLKLQALIDAELASQFPHRTPNDVGAALAELEPHLLRILQRLAQPSPPPASPAPSRPTRVRLAYEYDSGLASEEPQPQPPHPPPQQPLSKEKVIIINGMTHPEPLWPPPRSSTPSSPLVSVRLHTSEGEEGEAGEPQVLIRRGASRHDGGLLDDDSGSHNGGLDNDYDDDDDVSSVSDFPRPASRRRAEATMRSERRTPKSEGRPRSHSRAEREKPNIIDVGEEVVRPLVEGGRPRSHSRVEREKPNIIDVGGGEDQTPASVGRRHRSERGSSKKEQKTVVVVVKEELDDKEKKEDHGDDDEDDDLEAWTAGQLEGGAKKRKGPPPRARSGSISGRVPQIEARIPPAVTAAPSSSASAGVSRRVRSGSVADVPPLLLLGGVYSPSPHQKGLGSPRHGGTRMSPALSLSFELEVKEKKKEKEKEKKKKRSKSMGSKEEAKDVDRTAANSEEKTPTKMKRRWMTMRKMNSGKVPKAMSDTMVATRDEAEEQQLLQGGSSEALPPSRKGASGSSSLSGRSKSGPIARASKAKAASPRVARANSMEATERRKVAPHTAGAAKKESSGAGSGKGVGGEDSLSSPSKKKTKKDKEKRKKERKKEKEKMKEKDRRSSSEEDQRRIVFNRSQKLDI
jgi:hypothetical protein